MFSSIAIIMNDRLVFTRGLFVSWRSFFLSSYTKSTPANDLLPETSKFRKSRAGRQGASPHLQPWKLDKEGTKEKRRNVVQVWPWKMRC